MLGLKIAHTYPPYLHEKIGTTHQKYFRSHKNIDLLTECPYPKTESNVFPKYVICLKNFLKSSVYVLCTGTRDLQIEKDSKTAHKDFLDPYPK